MKKIPTTYLLIIFLTTLATILVVWRLFFYSPGEPPAVPTSMPTPTLSPLPTPTKTTQEGLGDSPAELAESLKKKFPLFPYLPYETAKFKIDYIAAFRLKVILKTEKTIAIEEEILNWIGSKGVAPATHQIEWTISE